MISYLEGRVISKTDRAVVISAGGVGYKAFVPLGVSARLPGVGETAYLFTHLHVREDGMELYGFLHATELELFELLITVSGVGPRVALAVISTEKPAVLAGAIASEDKNFLTKISGIGRKIAEKLIVELKDKVESLSFGSQAPGAAALDGDAIDALVVLGWQVRDAREALQKVPKDITKTELRVKEALKNLGK